MIGSRLIKSNNVAAGCEDIVDAYDPFAGNGVALYQLNGNANDVSGTYNGTAINETYTTGVFGQAMVGNGTNTRVDISGLNVSTFSAISISAWVYWQSTDEPKVFGGSSGSVTNRQTFNVECNSNRVRYIDNQQDLYDAPITLATGWHHFAVTDDYNGNHIIYVDGQAITSNFIVSSNYSANTSATMFYGMRNTGSVTGSETKGTVDQVRIFNTVLLPLEIEALYIEELCICGGTVDTLDILDDSSCIATYQLDGNANDLSGNYPGTPTDVSYGVGEFDLAGVFNGSSSYVEILNSNYDVRGNFSLSLWFNLNDLSANQTLFAKILNTSEKPLTIRVLTDGRLLVEQEGNNSNYNKFSTNTVSAGNWYNLVWTADASFNGELFINKVSFLTTNPGTVNINNGVPSLIGIMGAPGSVYNGSSPFNGSIDQVRIFNKALSAGEVTTLYNETACTPAACTSGTTNTLQILGDSSCIATYTLDGTPADLSGNYNGVQTDVTYPQGYFDLAASFNGSSSISVTNSIKSTFTGNFSASVWAKPTSVALASQAILDFFEGAGIGCKLQIDSSKVRFISYNGSSYDILNTSSILSNNVWYNFVLTKSSNNYELFTNGVSVGTLTSNTATETSNPFGIGYSTQNGQYFNGSIDQVRVFNKAISASEVTTLYNETPCN